MSIPKDKLENTNLHKYKGDLPIEIRKVVLPNPEMLGKCLRDKTQYAIKSFNGMIWNRVPKSTHVGINILSAGVYDAVAHFNYGGKAALDIMKLLKISPGVYMIEQAMPNSQYLPQTQLILQNVRITENSLKITPPFQNKAAG